ncbi:hypothetical protein [Streptomyces sp. NPDC127092]|uniref:hypothetical protein n=1 Tax=Streptomyces sp. NPDC127092 TaxID=3347135 RepID=UPI0036567DFF
MNFLLLPLCIVLGGVLPALWANGRTRSLRRAFASGKTVGLPAEVAWQSHDGQQDQGATVRGDLWLTGRGDAPLHFVAEGSTILTLPRGGRIRDVAPQRAKGLKRSFVHRETVVYQVPGAGARLAITVDQPSAEIVTKALTQPGGGQSEREKPADVLQVAPWQRIRVPGAAALLLSGALLLALFGAHTFLLGREVTAEVSGVRDAQCQVVWQDPWDASRTRHARVDCYQGEKPGDALRISARPWPARGEAADLEDSPFMVVFGVSAAGLAGLVGIASASLGAARRLRLLRGHLGRGGGANPPGAARVVVPWWSWATGTLGLAGLGLMTLAYGFGQPVRAEVTGTTDYGSCAVAWADPWDGARHTAEVDCDGVSGGDSLEVSALPWPLRGEAFDRDFTPVALGIVTVAHVGVALLGIGLRSRRSRRGRLLTSTPEAASTATSVPPQKQAGGDPARTGDVLDRGHLTAVSRLLFARDVRGSRPRSRGPEPDPGSHPWWRSPVLRRVALTSGVSWGALIVLGVTALWSGGWWMTALHSATDRSETSVATVEYLYDDLPLEPWPLPGEAEMSFVTADGRRVVTDIAHGDPVPAEGDTIGIAYAAGRPSVAWIPGDPGLGRGLWASGTVAALAVVRLVWCTVSFGRTLRRVLRAARCGEARRLDYLLLPGGGEKPRNAAPLLVLFEPGARRPAAVMEVEPSAVLLPTEGTLDLRSAPQDSAAAVAVIGEQLVWPFGPLTLLADQDEEEYFRQYVTDLVPPGVALDPSDAHGHPTESSPAADRG